MIGLLGVYLFVVHMLTARQPFIPAAVFKDRNFISSLLLMFTLGVVMLASSALLPPFLQNLGGYTVTDVGLLLAPRGVGTMVAMLFAGRLSLKVDPRYLMTVGAVLMLWAMYEMSTWTPSVHESTLIIVTFIQGIGMGLLFIPNNLIAFATLAPVLRTDGSALLNLVRNVGSAMGVSITTTVLDASYQISHAELAEHINPFNRGLTINAPAMMWNPQLPFGLEQVNAVIDRNAYTIAYANDFLFMFLVSLPVLVVIFFMKRPPRSPRK